MISLGWVLWYVIPTIVLCMCSFVVVSEFSGQFNEEMSLSFSSLNPIQFGRGNSSPIAYYNESKWYTDKLDINM